MIFITTPINHQPTTNLLANSVSNLRLGTALEQNPLVYPARMLPLQLRYRVTFDFTFFFL